MEIAAETADCYIDASAIAAGTFARWDTALYGDVHCLMALGILALTGAVVLGYTDSHGPCHADWTNHIGHVHAVTKRGNISVNECLVLACLLHILSPYILYRVLMLTEDLSQPVD